MHEQVSTALKRLDSILPLHSGLLSLNSENAGLYCKLLHAYTTRGETLTREEVTDLVDDAKQSLDTIANSKLVVLDDEGNPAGAYPFTSQEREHKVKINGITVHCMCALDALAVSPMFGVPTVIDSECRVTRTPVHLQQNSTGFSGGTTDVWFGIDWGAAASDTVVAESLCLEMMFLINEKVATEWLAESPDTREIFNLPSAVEFAEAFFVPLVDDCWQAA